MLAILYGLEVLEKIMGTNIAEIDEIQINGMKQILPLSNSTSNTVILTETEIGPVNKKLECCTMMMYCRIINSDDQRIAKKNNKRTTKYRQLRVKEIEKKFNIETEKVEMIKKSNRKRIKEVIDTGKFKRKVP